MKRMLFAISALSAVVAAASSSVGNVQVSQNFPWDGRAVITFTVSGDPCYVGLSATWYGQPVAVQLAPPALSGMPDTPYAAGTYSVMWDSVAAGYGNGEKAEFKVRAYAVSAADTQKDYLVFDLATGRSEFLDTPPVGGWTDEYKSRYMPFRRIPAGTYTNGLDSAYHNVPIPNGNVTTTVVAKNRGLKPVEVVISAPYYVAVFPVTSGQGAYIDGDSLDDNPSYRTRRSYVTLRGNPATDGINWPDTGFEVATNSFIRKMRDRTTVGMPPGWILDLPTSAQWEIAMRARTTTIFPNGGDENTTPAGFTNIVNEIANWGGHNSGMATVGLNSPNQWGIYDMAGLVDTVMIDAADSTHYNDSHSHRAGTDPKGKSVTASTTSVVCRGGNWSSKEIFTLMPSWWYSTTITSLSGFRPVINTRDWTR